MTILKKEEKFEKKKIVGILLKYLTYLKIGKDFCNFCQNCFLCENHYINDNSVDVINEYILDLIN